MRDVAFDPNGFEDLAWWIKQDRRTALRIVRMIKEAQRTPFEGIGKPEPLKYELMAGLAASRKSTGLSIKSRKIPSGF